MNRITQKVPSGEFIEQDYVWELGPVREHAMKKNDGLQVSSATLYRAIECGSLCCTKHPYKTTFGKPLIGIHQNSFDWLPPDYNKVTHKEASYISGYNERYVKKNPAKFEPFKFLGNVYYSQKILLHENKISYDQSSSPA